MHTHSISTYDGVQELLVSEPRSFDHFVHRVGWRKKGMGEVMNADSIDTNAMSEAL